MTSDGQTRGGVTNIGKCCVINAYFSREFEQTRDTRTPYALDTTRGRNSAINAR